VNIAKRTKGLAASGVKKPPPFDLSAMCDVAQKMVNAAADALVDSDSKGVRNVLTDDDEIDRMHRQAISQVENQIGKQPEAVDYYLNLLSVSRYLERIADHATNIAEDVIYMVEGEIVRHQGG
jgi:phosphate transport system protein